LVKLVSLAVQHSAPFCTQRLIFLWQRHLGFRTRGIFWPTEYQLLKDGLTAYSFLAWLVGWTRQNSAQFGTLWHIFLWQRLLGCTVSSFARLEIFTAMKFQVVVFWVMTPCSFQINQTSVNIIRN